MKIILTPILFLLLFFQVNAASTINNLNIVGGTHLCPGGNYSISFDTLDLGTFNLFTLQISSSTGSFSSPILTSSPTGFTSINFTVPATATPSLNYVLKIFNNKTPNPISATINITITKPNPSFTYTPSNPCAGTTVNFTNTSTGALQLFATWNFGATTGAPAATNTYSPGVSFNPALGGGSINYSVSLLITDAYGCFNSTSTNLPIRQLPDPRIFAPLSVVGNFQNVPISNTNPDTIRKCNNVIPYLLTIANSSTTNSINSNYKINWGDNSAIFDTSVFSSNISHTYSAQGEYNLQLLVTGVNGCSISKNKYIYIGTNPSIGLGNPGNTTGECIVKSYTFPITGFVSNSPGTRYLFSSNDKGNDTSFVHPPPNSYTKNYPINSCGFNSLGNYFNSFHLRVTAINACASSAATVEPIQLSSKPQADFYREPITCINTNTIIINTSSNGRFIDPSPPNNCDTATFPEWEVIPATGWTLISGLLGPAMVGTDQITLKFTTVGEFQIKLKAISPAYLLNPNFTCGIDTITKTICVQPIPIPSFTLNSNNANNCVPATITANNTSNTLNSCATPIYTWSIRDSLTSTVLNPGNRFVYTNSTDSNSVNPTFRFLQKGRYVIRLRISNTCPGVFIKDTLVIIKDIPVVSLRPDIIYCGNQSLDFAFSNPSHNPTYDSSFSNITSFNWNITPSTGFSFVTGNANSRNPTISFTNTTSLPIVYRVILTATNVCGTSAPDTQNITINPKPIVGTNSTNSAFCSGGNTNIVLSHNLAGAVQYYWRAYPSSSFVSGFSNQLTLNPGPISQTLINTGNNIETVTYKIAGFQSTTNCSGDSSTVVVTVYPIPRVLAFPQSICSGTILNLSLNSTVSGSFFTWTANSINSLITGFSNNSTPVSGPIVHTLTNTSNSTPDTVRYTIRASANNCNSPDTIIKISVSPNPLISGSNQTICSANQISLNPTSSVFGSSFNYSASLINGTVTGHSSGSVIPINQTLTNTGSTTALVRYTISSSGPSPTNCPSLPVNIDVTVNPKPVLSISNSSTICSGTSTSITLNSNVTNSFYRYNTSLISGTNTSGFYPKTTDTIGPINQTIYNTGTTNSVVRYSIVPIIGGCAGDTVFHIVTIIPGPVRGTISTAGPFCSGNNNFNLTLSGNTGTVVRWEKSVSPFTSYDPITHTGTTLSQSNLTQTTKYRAVINTGVGGSCGSVNTPDITVQIDSISLGGTLTGADTVCTGTNSGNIVLSGKRGTVQSWLSAPNFSGTWSNISGTNGLNSYTYSNLVSTTWYKVQVKNGVCPVAFSDSIRILVDQNPSNALAFDTSFCLNTIGTPISGFVRANPITVGTGIWQFLSGPSSSTVNQTNQILTGISNLLNGDYYYTWRVSNGKCPAKQDTAKVTVLLPIVSSIGTAQTICFGQTASLLVGTATTGGTGSFSFQWQESLDNSIFTNITGATLSNYNPGSLSVSKWFRRITNSGACTHISNSVKITVLPAIGNNSISANLSYCIGNSSNPIMGSIPSGGNGVYHFQWQKFVSGSWINTSSTDTLINYSPGALTQTTDFRRIVTSDVCSGAQQLISNTVTHTVFPLPTVNAGLDFTKCNNQAPFTLIGSPSAGTWSGPQAIVANTVNPAAYSIGVYPLVYTFTNSNNCTNRDTVLFTVIAPPTVNAGNGFAICENTNSIQLGGFSPVGGTWSGQGVSVSGLFNPLLAGSGTKQLVYTFTAGTGCSGVDTLLMTVYPQASPNFNLAPKICALDTLNLNATFNSLASINTYQWLVNNNGGLNNEILNSYNATYTTAIFPENLTLNDYTYTFKLILTTNFGCVDSISKSILQLRRPNANFVTGSNINCGPANYTMSNGTANVNSTYLWSVSPTSDVTLINSNSTNPQITLPVNTSNALISYEVKLIATRNTAELGCRDTFTAPLLVYPKPLANFTMSPSSSGCSPQTVLFTNASDPKNSENIGEMRFVWSFTGMASDTNPSLSRTFYNKTGIIDSLYNITLIGTSKWGCKDTMSNSVTVYPFPKSDFTGTNYSNCAPFLLNGTNISLTQYAIANDSYIWQILDKGMNVISTSTGTNIPAYTINQANDTVYYRLITSNVHACKPDTLTRLFRTISNPKADFALSDSVGCHPLNINITSLSTVGVGHLWNFGNGSTSTLINPSQTYINNSNTVDSVYQIRLVVTAGTGCTDTLKKSILVYPKPLASFILADKVCALDSTTITNQSVFKTGTVNYSWTRTSPVNSLMSFSSTTVNQPSIYFPENTGIIDSVFQIRLVVTSVNSCVDDTIRAITQLRRPNANFVTGSNINCGPANYTMSNGTTNVGSTYLWSVSPTSGVFLNNSNSTNPQITLPVNTSNAVISYEVKLIATRNTAELGCKDTFTAPLLVYPKPLTNFTMSPSNSGCSPQTVLFTNASDPKNSENISEMRFVWSFTGMASDTNPSLSRTFYNRTGIIDSLYTITLIGTSKWGCKDTMSNSVTVYPFPKSNFTGTNYSNCAPFLLNGTNISLTQYAIANDTYIWQILDKGMNVISTSTGINIPTYTINLANDTVYYRLITSNVHGCKPDTLTRLFRTISNPKADFTLSDSVGCHPLNINITSLSTVGVGHLWNFGNGSTSTLINPSQTYINNSNTVDSVYQIRLVVTAGTGCTDTLKKSITVYPKPLASFVLADKICALDSTTITNQSVFKTGTVNYSWTRTSPVNSLMSFSSTTVNQPSFYFPENTGSIDSVFQIRLVVTSVNSCVDDTIRAITQLRRPNANFVTGSNINCGPANYTMSNGTTNVGSTYLWSVSPTSGVFLNNSNSTNPQITLPVNTSNAVISYEVKLIATRNTAELGCKDTFTAPLLVYPKPLTNFTMSPSNSGCSPQTVLFTNASDPKNSENISEMRFVWSFTGMATDTNPSLSRTFYNRTGVIDSLYNITLIGTSKWGCKDTMSNSVTVYPFPKSNFTGTNYSNCAPFLLNGTNISLTQYAIANDTYIWQILDKGLIVISTSTGINIPTYTINLANDTVYYRLITSNVHGCKPDTLVRLFRTIENPRALFSLSDSVGCHPLNINITSLSTVGVGHAWSFGNGNTSTLINPNQSFINNSNTIDSTYQIRLVVTAGTGCTDTLKKSVIVYPKPFASFSITNQTCAGINVLPINTSLFKTGSVQYTWSRVSPILSGLSFSDTTSANPNIFIPNNKGSFDSSYIVKLKVQTVNGCIDDTNNSIVSLRRPLADFVLPNPNCGPTSILVSNQTNNVSATFLWASTPGISQINTSSSTNPNLSFSENLSPDSINYQIKLLATRTIGNCLDSITKTVTVYPKPIADFTSNSLDSCGPRLMSFTNVSNARNTEPRSSLINLWTYLNKSSNSLNSSDTFRNSGVLDSSYLARLIVTSLHGCKDTIEKNVMVRPNAKAVFNWITVISCAPFTINSTNITVTHFSEANLLYSWYANGTFLGNGLSFPGYTIANQADSVLIKLKVSSKNNCKADSLEMWFYTIENPKPNFFAVDSITCSGVLIQFNNTSTPANGLSYQWKYGNNLIAETIKNPANKFYNFGDFDTTIYIKLITIAGGTGCLDSIVKSIVIKPLPNPNFVFNDSIVCFPIKPNLQITSLNVPLINSTTYQWSINPGLAFVDNDTASISTFIHTPDNQSGISNNYAVKLKVASGFGCIDSISKIFRVPTRPIAQIGLVPDSSCGPKTIITNNTSSFGLNYNWTSLKNGPIINNLNSFNTGIQFPNHEGIIDSIYPIQLLVITSEGCRDSITKPFKIFPKPIASFVTDLDSGCAPLDIQFASTSIVQKPASYSWNFGDGNTINTSKDSALWTYLGSRNQDTTFNSTLILTSVNGCKDTISKFIDVQAGAVAILKLTDTIICSNAVNPTKLTIQNLSFGSVDTFYWDFGDGNSLVTLSDSTINHPYPIEGVYRIVLKAVNTCRVSFDTAFVLVQTPPNVNFTKSDSVGCSPMKVDFVNISTDTFRANFLWNAGNGFTSNNFQIPQQTYLQSLTTDTFYFPTLIISNICGVYKMVDTVMVLPLPTAFFIINTDSGCSPLEVKFQNKSFGVPDQFYWNFGDGRNSNRENPIPDKNTFYTYDTPTVYTIKLRVSNICGADSMSKTVKVMPNTVQSFFTTSTQFGCENLTVKFTDLSSGGPNVSWNFGDGNTSSLKNPTYTFDTPGIFRVYQYVNNNCSFDSSSVVVSVYPKPKFTIDKNSDSFCVLQPAQFYANLLDSGDITWYFGDGDTSNEYNPIHKYNVAGFKIVRALLRSVSNFCINEKTLTVLVNEIPNVSLAADSLRACLNVPIKFKATANGNPFLFWDFGDGSFGNGVENEHYFLYPGNFNVKVRAVNAASCSDTARANIKIYPIPETNFDYSPKDTCTGPAWVNFTNLTQGDNTYLWNFGNGNSSNKFNERQLFNNIGEQFNSLIATNIYLCKDTVKYPFTIYEKPISRFDFDPSEICVGESIQFTNNSKLAKKYIWYFGDGDSSNFENPAHIYKDSGEYYVSLLAFAGDVCFDSLRTTKKIVVYPKPNPDFSSVLLTNSKPYRSVIFSYTGTSGNDFIWTSDKGNIGKGRTIGYTFAEADSGCFKVNLFVSSEFGCDTALSKPLCLPTYFTGLFVPNAFTPDFGESKASCFLPSGIELDHYWLKIYNKWGELVWESQSLLNGEPSEAWCGDNKYTGDQCPQGTYLWTIEASYTNKKSWEGMLYPGADKKVRVGNVTLIR